MSYQHGIYVTEQGTELIAPIEGTAALQVIIGTAPVNRAKDMSAPLEPKLVHRFDEAVEVLGYSDDWQDYSLCQSMDACFRVFNIAPIIFINVLDPKKHKKENPTADVAVVGGVARYEKQGVLLKSLQVKAAAGETALVLGTDYIAEFAADGTVTITILPSGAAKTETTLKVTSDSLDPSAITEADIAGGLDTITGAETGIALVRQVYPLFSMVPGLLLAPGWSHKPTVAAALQAKCEGINGAFRCETLLDIDCGADGVRRYSNVANGKSVLGVTDKHAVALWPMLAVGTKQYRYSALLGACIAYTDAQNGDVPNLSPSNKAIRATAAVLEDGSPVLLDQEQANFINGVGVMTALNVAGGIRTWGNNTAAYPATTDQKDRWVCVRRFFSWWANSFIMTYFQKVDDPTNARLIENVCDSENVRGNGFVAEGKCAGAHITYREDENNSVNILGGHIKFHQALAPYTPAEVIENVLEFDPRALQGELTNAAE